MCLQEGVEPVSCWGLPGTTTRTAPAAWHLPTALPLAILPSIFCPNPCHGSKPFYAGSSSLQWQDQCVGPPRWDCEALWPVWALLIVSLPSTSVRSCGHWPPPIPGYLLSAQNQKSKQNTTKVRPPKIFYTYCVRENTSPIVLIIFCTINNSHAPLI